MPLIVQWSIIAGLFAQGFAQSQTQSPSASPAGPTVVDGTAALSFPPRTAESSDLSPLTWGAVSFSVNESDPTCGPGRWSLTQLSIPLSQVTVSVVDIQVQLYTANVGVRGSIVLRGGVCYVHPHFLLQPSTGEPIAGFAATQVSAVSVPLTAEYVTLPLTALTFDTSSVRGTAYAVVLSTPDQINWHSVSSPAPAYLPTSGVAAAIGSWATPDAGTSWAVASPYRGIWLSAQKKVCSPTPSQTPSQTRSQSSSPSQTLSSSESPTQTSSSTPSLAGSASLTQSPSAAASVSSTQSCSGAGTLTLTPTPSATSTSTSSRSGLSTPTSSGTPTFTSSQSSTPTGAETASLTLSPSASQTPSATQSPTASSTATSSSAGTRSGSTTPSPTPTLSQSATPSPTLTPSATLPPTPSPSLTQTLSRGASQSQARTGSPTTTSTQFPTPSTTPSQTQTPTPSVSRQPFSLRLIAATAGAIPPDFSAPMSPETRPIHVSDSAAATPVAVWISRCPGLGVSLRCTADAGVAQPLLWSDAVQSPYITGVISSAGSACDSSSTSPVLLSVSASVGAAFRTAGGAASMSCQVFDSSSGGSLGFETAPLAITPSLWPVWEDAVLVASASAMRSARLGVSLNATAAFIAALSCNASFAGSRGGVSDDCQALLTNATLPTDPSAVLATVASVWGSLALPNASDSSGFSLTLTGASLVVLRAARVAFSLGLNVSLGGVPCVVLAVTADGLWALVQTPPPAQLCGSVSTECGYRTFRLSLRSGASANTTSNTYAGASLACPPICPGSIDPPSRVPAFLAVAADATLVSISGTAAGALSVSAVASSAAAAVSSGGLYYTLACSQTGLFTDPASGACSNASNPASFACALGSGAACSACPTGSLCPGGSRLWPRPGYWSASETAGAAVACPPPSAISRCLGWDVTNGATRCGAGYLPGSYLCGACARSFYTADEGTCAPCPVVTSPWDRYRGLLLLIAGLLAFVAAVGAGLLLLLRCVGGSLAGGAGQLGALAIWALTSLQAVSQVSRVSSASLPPLLAILYRAVAVLQLQGVVLPPACTGAYPFETQVGVMGAAVGAWALAACIYASGTSWRTARLAGRGLLTLAIVLFPTSLEHAVSLLDCQPATLSAAALATLDGGSAATTASSTTTVTVPVLASNQFFVCWVAGGSHRTAGIVAAVTLGLLCVGLPAVTLIWLRHDPWLRDQLRAESDSRRAASRGSPVAIASPTIVDPVDRLSLETVANPLFATNHQQPPSSPDPAATPTLTPPLTADTSSVPRVERQPASLRAAPPLPTRRQNMSASRSRRLATAPSSRRVASGAGQAPDYAAAVEVPVIDPLLAPFLGDYRPSAWATKHVDLALLTILATMQALLRSPSGLAAIAAKATVLSSATLAVAVYVLVRRPFPALAEWKRWVRVALLCLGAGCAVVNAAVSAHDEGATGVGPISLDAFISGASYALFGGCCVVGILLIAGFCGTLISAARAEQREIEKVAAEAAERKRRRTWTATRTEPAPSPATGTSAGTGAGGSPQLRQGGEASPRPSPRRNLRRPDGSPPTPRRPPVVIARSHSRAARAAVVASASGSAAGTPKPRVLVPGVPRAPPPLQSVRGLLQLDLLGGAPEPGQSAAVLSRVTSAAPEGRMAASPSMVEPSFAGGRSGAARR